MGKKKTHEQFIKEITVANPLVIIKGYYKGSHTPILCTCVECKNDFQMSPSDLLNGHRCKKCANKVSAMKRMDTHEDFLEKLHKIYTEIEIISEYKGSQESISCRCTKCGNEWITKPNYLLDGTRCPVCSNNERIENSRWTQERFEEELHKADSTIEVIGKYKGYNEKILVHCKDCDTVYKTTPHILINGHKCKACAMKAVGEMKTKSTDTFITELRSISPNIEIIGEYVQSKEKVECLCKDCGNIWFATPNNLLKGNNCPVCSVKKSKSEKKIQEILDKQGIVYESQKKYDDLFGVGNKLLSYDFYIPRYNILIEAQGQQHENPIEIFGGEKQFKIQQEHDKRKREYAENNGYKLLEIWYYDYDRIEEILNRELEVG